MTNGLVFPLNPNPSINVILCSNDIPRDILGLFEMNVTPLADTFLAYKNYYSLKSEFLYDATCSSWSGFLNILVNILKNEDGKICYSEIEDFIIISHGNERAIYFDSQEFVNVEDVEDTLPSLITYPINKLCLVACNCGRFNNISGLCFAETCLKYISSISHVYAWYGYETTYSSLYLDVSGFGITDYSIDEIVNYFGFWRFDRTKGDEITKTRLGRFHEIGELN